jgi:hypothetical protein
MAQRHGRLMDPKKGTMMSVVVNWSSKLESLIASIVIKIAIECRDFEYLNTHIMYIYIIILEKHL